MNSIYFIFLVVFCLLFEGVFAQNLSNPEDDHEYAKVSLIALGAKPRRTYKTTQEGNAKMLEARQYTVPLAKVYFEDEHSKEWKSLTVGFNNQGGFTRVPANEILAIYREKNDEEAPYFTIPSLEKNARYIAFLIPHGKSAKPWKNSPNVIVERMVKSTPNDLKIRILNLSNQALTIDLKNESKMHLLPKTKKTLSFDASLSQNRSDLTIKSEADGRLLFREPLNFHSSVMKLYAIYEVFDREEKVSKLRVFRASYDVIPLRD